MPSPPLFQQWQSFIKARLNVLGNFLFLSMASLYDLPGFALILVDVVHHCALMGREFNGLEIFPI